MDTTDALTCACVCPTTRVFAHALHQCMHACVHALSHACMNWGDIRSHMGHNLASWLKCGWCVGPVPWVSLDAPLHSLLKSGRKRGVPKWYTGTPCMPCKNHIMLYNDISVTYDDILFYVWALLGVAMHSVVFSSRTHIYTSICIYIYTYINT